VNGALPPEERLLALATKRAIEAAGHLAVCAPATGLSDSHLSRCSSIDSRDSITIRDARTIDALGTGVAGHPFILQEYARQIGFVAIQRPTGPQDPDGIMQSMMELTSELGDVAASISAGLRDRKINAAEARHALDQLFELDRASATLRHKLEELAKEA
jgi:hypothetical protein